MRKEQRILPQREKVNVMFSKERVQIRAERSDQGKGQKLEGLEWGRKAEGEKH